MCGCQRRRSYDAREQINHAIALAKPVNSFIFLYNKALTFANRQPLSDVPIDLVLLHLLLPYTMHYFRPVKGIKRMVERVWRNLATRLRLTSYMFGGRHDSEEFSARHWSWKSFVPGAKIDDANLVHNGTFRRVPATDSIALPRDMRATAQVTADGEPVDEESRELIAAQNAEAEKAKRSVNDDYTVVYIPPLFRQRLIVFITCLWTIGALSFGSSLAVPLIIGRAAFWVALGREVHDGYSFIVGFYLLWGCHVFGKAVDRMDKRRQRRGMEGPRADLPVYVVKRSLPWAMKISYMVFFLGLVIPILIATVMELYLLLPIRYAVDPHVTPRVRVADLWCLGVLYAKIALHASQLQQPTRITSGVRNVSASKHLQSPVGATTHAARGDQFLQQRRRLYIRAATTLV